MPNGGPAPSSLAWRIAASGCLRTSGGGRGHRPVRTAPERARAGQLIQSVLNRKANGSALAIGLLTIPWRLVEYTANDVGTTNQMSV